MFGVSRCLANMGYVFWVLALGTTMMGLFILLEIVVYFTEFEKPIERNEDNINEDSAKVVKTSYTPIRPTDVLFYFFVGATLIGLMDQLRTFFRFFRKKNFLIKEPILICIWTNKHWDIGT